MFLVILVYSKGKALSGLRATAKKEKNVKNATIYTLLPFTGILDTTGITAATTIKHFLLVASPLILEKKKLWYTKTGKRCVLKPVSVSYKSKRLSYLLRGEDQKQTKNL